jgi:hypothetical protein
LSRRAFARGLGVVVRVVRIAVVVRMLVIERGVVVSVRVLADKRWVVVMRVVTIIVTMHVVVRGRRVMVEMAMLLGQVKPHAGCEQRDRRTRPDAEHALTREPRDQRADERCQREHGAGAGCPDPALREDVERER